MASMACLEISAYKFKRVQPILMEIDYLFESKQKLRKLTRQPASSKWFYSQHGTLRTWHDDSC